LKTRLLPKLQSLYSFVAVPVEAPEKPDFGDLDFVVACPKADRGGRTTQDAATPPNAPHDVVQSVIGARFSNCMEGNRTSNFAVPVAEREWDPLGHAQDEEQRRGEAEGGEIFYQVDINVCADRGEWERIVFFHGYGDLGMILGLIAKNAGLALGSKGLRLPNPPHPPVELSESFDEIMEFMGMSMEIWKAGFNTKREAFEWAGTCRFFDPRRFRSSGEGIRKVKQDRKMYAEFVEWAMERAASAGEAAEELEMRQEREVKFKDEAVIYFKRKEALDAQTRQRELRIRVKDVFSGSKVREWTGLGNHWKGVKVVMDAVRERVGGSEGVLRIFEAEGEEGLKRVVLAVQKELEVE